MCIVSPGFPPDYPPFIIRPGDDENRVPLCEVRFSLNLREQYPAVVPFLERTPEQSRAIKMFCQ